MRSLAGQLVVPLLVTLLVFTTPVGTGQGVHQAELLHPVFGHVHLIDGRVVTDAQLAAARAVADADPARSVAPRGPALGAGSGSDAAGAGLALGPVLQTFALSFVSTVERRGQVPDGLPPIEFRDSPQDPPPDPFA